MVRLKAVIFDTMLESHLLMPDLPKDLEFVASIFINKEAWKGRKSESEEIYCARDVDATLQIHRQLLPRLKQEKLLNLYLDVQVPLAKICLLMHETGVKVDPARVTEIRERLTKEIAELEAKLPEVLRTKDVPVRRRIPAPPGTRSKKTGKPIKFLMADAVEQITPWRSNDSLADYLYVDLALPKQLHIKTREVTVDKSSLEKLQRKLRTKEFEKYPKLVEATQALAALRAIKKLSTLLSGFATENLAKAEVIHTHFNVHGTATGRLSSSDPNLQNQPPSTRYLYIPSHSGWEFLSVDFSGIENKLTAYLADDQERLQKFLTDPDYNEHKYATQVLFGIPYNEVVKDNDRTAPYGIAKSTNHGINYGLSPRKFSLMYETPEAEAKRYFALWKAAIPKTIAWQERTAKAAEQTGYLTNPFGRRRWFWWDGQYTDSLSTLPQGTAADVIFRSMIGLCFDRISLCLESARRVTPICIPLPRPARLLLQVHDELLFEYPREMREEVAGTVKAVMEQPWPELGDLSFRTGMAIGESWGELETYKL